MLEQAVLLWDVPVWIRLMQAAVLLLALLKAALMSLYAKCASLLECHRGVLCFCCGRRSTNLGGTELPRFDFFFLFRARLSLLFLYG